MATKMNKTKVKMNNLGIGTLDISKTVLYEFWYDYIKPKYQDKAKLKIFTKTLLMMLKNGLSHLTMMKMIKGHFQLVKTRK